MSSKQNKIGIVIPAYNCQDTIVRLLKSIYKQSYSNYNVVIINDGSKDNTRSVIETYFKDINNDKRFKLINIKNGGVSNARNIGIENISCDYLLFIDSDDWYNDGYFESINNNVNGYDFLVYSYSYYMNEKYKIISCDISNDCNKKDFYEILNSHNLFNSSCNKVYRYDFVKQFKFDTSISYGEDFEFVMRFFTEVKDYKYVDEAYYNYDLSTGHLGFKNWDNSFQLKTVGLKTLEKFYDKYSYDKTSVYKGYIKALVLDLADLIVRKKVNKYQFVNYRNNCYTYYDVRKIKVSGFYDFINKIYISNYFVFIKLCSYIIIYLKKRKVKKLINN